jgi:hypothetical protein
MDLLSSDPKNLKVQQFIKQRLEMVKKRQLEFLAQANHSSTKKARLTGVESFLEGGLSSPNKLGFPTMVSPLKSSAGGASPSSGKKGRKAHKSVAF